MLPRMTPDDFLNAIRSGNETGTNDYLTANPDAIHNYYDSDTALTIAVKAGQDKIVSQLIAAGADTGVLDHEGHTILMLAVLSSNNTDDVITTLLNNNMPNLTASIQTGETAEEIALRIDKIHIAAHIGDTISRFQPPPPSRITPAQYFNAAKMGLRAIVQRYINENPNTLNYHFNALKIAAQSNNINIVKILLTVPGIELTKTISYDPIADYDHCFVTLLTITTHAEIKRLITNKINEGAKTEVSKQKNIVPIKSAQQNDKIKTMTDTSHAYTHGSPTTVNRFHLWSAKAPTENVIIQINSTNYTLVDATLNLSGDKLKYRILDTIKIHLDDISDIAEFNKYKSDVIYSEAYTIIKQSQGFTTWFFSLKTDSQKALEKMFAEKEKYFQVTCQPSAFSA